QVGFPLIGGLIRVKKTYGYYKTDKLIEDLGKVMAAKGFSPDLTFEELYIAHQSGKNVKLLYLTGANLTDQKTEVFSHETYPTMQVLDAVRISISIPMYFEAVFMQPDGSLVEKKDADSTTKVMVDGGVLDNYPFFVFDTLVTVNSGDNSYYKCNIHSLGIKLETDSSTLDIATRTIGRTGDFMGAFSGLSSEHLNRRHLGPQQTLQTIFINKHNYNPKLKRQKRAKKLRVMQYGRKAVFEYFISR
ncbi:MAG: patatin-like phospholipase family protein, partial [Bacteroidia bacterium]